MAQQEHLNEEMIQLWSTEVVMKTVKNSNKKLLIFLNKSIIKL